jgi:hypothetical protein
MPPVQENSPAAVATTFSDRESKEITIVPPVERISQRKEVMNEKGLVNPVITRWLEEGAGKTSLLWRHSCAAQIMSPSDRHGGASVGFKT